MKNTVLRIPNELHEQAKEACHKEGVSLNKMYVTAIEVFLNGEKMSQKSSTTPVSTGAYTVPEPIDGSTTKNSVTPDNSVHDEIEYCEFCGDPAYWEIPPEPMGDDTTHYTCDRCVWRSTNGSERQYKTLTSKMIKL